MPVMINVKAHKRPYPKGVKPGRKQLGAVKKRATSKAKKAEASMRFTKAARYEQKARNADKRIGRISKRRVKGTWPKAAAPAAVRRSSRLANK